MPPGTTTVCGTPATPLRARVVLHDQLSGNPLREQWSDAGTGAYQFKNIREGRFFVMAFDPSETYSGEVETGIVVPAP